MAQDNRWSNNGHPVNTSKIIYWTMVWKNLCVASSLPSRSISSNLALASPNSRMISRVFFHGCRTTSAIMSSWMTGIHKFRGRPTIAVAMGSTHPVSGRLCCNHRKHYVPDDVDQDNVKQVLAHIAVFVGCVFYGLSMTTGLWCVIVVTVTLLRNVLPQKTLTHNSKTKRLRTYV